MTCFQLLIFFAADLRGLTRIFFYKNEDQRWVFLHLTVSAFTCVYLWLKNIFIPVVFWFDQSLPASSGFLLADRAARYAFSPRQKGLNDVAY